MNEKRDQSTAQSLLEVINHLLDNGTVAVVITVLRGLEAIGSKYVVEESGRTFGTLGNAELDSLVARRATQFLTGRDETRTIPVREFAPEFASSEEILLLFELLHPAPRLVICGAGHVGAALARLGSFVGYRTTLIDDRKEFVSRERFEGQEIELVLATNWTDAVRAAVGNGKGVAVAVVTRGHNQDEECMNAITDIAADYVGLIGSKRRTNIVIDNLRRAGFAEERLKAIRAPIGLDIGAVTPEEVALAIIAEIVAERHNRAGGSLSVWRRA
jgi:xanthine dehydrogenase accessory factor